MLSMNIPLPKEELHVCKICGEQMPREECFWHRDSTSHNKFRPVLRSDNDQEMKGGFR